MKSFSKVFKYVTKQWPLALAYLFANIMGVLFSVVSFSMAIPFLKFLFDPEIKDTPPPPPLSFNIEDLIANFQYQLADIVNEKGKLYGLVFISVILIVTTFLKNVFVYASNYALIPLRNTIVRDLRRDVFHKTLYLPLSYFRRERKGDLLTRLSLDITEVEHALFSASELIFKEPIYILTYLGVMFFISTPLTLFILVFLPIVGYLIGHITRSLRSKTVQNQSSIGEQMSVVEETFSGLRIVKSYNIESLQEKKYLSLNDYIYNISNKINWRRDLASPVSETLGVVVMATIILYGGYLILEGEGSLSAEGFVGFIIMFSQIISPLTKLSTIFYNIHKGRASLERLEEILDAPLQHDVGEIDVQKTSFFKSIRYENVSFDYEGTPILEEINLEIPHGKTIALVGESGSGKSTLVDLLSRFQDINNGKITIDGKDIKDMSLYHLRDLIGIVSQDPVLFNDTIENNINIRQEDIPFSKIQEVARVAHADGFIENKPHGYKTMVGDNGSNLSGGEKQRVTIARAVLKNAPILVLDEATSALDTVSESQVQAALENLKKNRTTIIIAHRLSTVKHADEIIVLNKGRILERGTHDELMEKGGAYSGLVAMQELK